ncbi:hypothetical protein CEXT_676901 [Caerostris extrusa]|uniref:Uncharacterized protein n=1 Tax=Caerostris extrusa TaxID=172846 RepID=A0AAV4Q263_CAEEX|nr:hypothetical protein CEXT_676901 [Caerostris extrusa]
MCARQLHPKLNNPWPQHFSTGDNRGCRPLFEGRRRVSDGDGLKKRCQVISSDIILTAAGLPAEPQRTIL